MAFTDHWEIESTADIWPLMTGNTADNPTETARQVAVILDGIPIGNRALEIGGGIGRLMKAVLWSSRFGEVTGVDSSMSIVQASQEYLRGTGIGVHLNDGVHLPFADSEFDFVFSLTCFQHMISLAIIHRNLREIRRVLTAGGLCRIQTINSNGDDPRDLKTYDGRVFRSADDFAEQFRAVGLDVINIRTGLTHERHIWITAVKRI